MNAFKNTFCLLLLIVVLFLGVWRFAGAGRTATLMKRVTDGVTTLSTDWYLGVGTASPDTTLDVDGTTSYTPSSVVTLNTPDSLTVTNTAMLVAGSGAVTLSATPTITGSGIDGQIFYIIGTDDTNTVTFQDESSLVGSNLQLASGADFTTGSGDTLTLMYIDALGFYVELEGSDN